MSKVDTEASAEARKVANAALVRGGLSGIRWLFNRAAGPAATGAGFGAKAYNSVVRPARAVLLPNLGRVGNRIRLGGAAYAAGHSLSHADEQFGKARGQLLQVSKQVSPEMQELVKARSTRLGALGAAFRASTGMFNGNMSLAARAADDVAKEGLTKAFRDGAAKHKDQVFSGKTLSSYLNPIGSRILSSAMTKLPGEQKSMEQYASQFSSKYKGLLGQAQTGISSIGKPKT